MKKQGYKILPQLACVLVIFWGCETLEEKRGLAGNYEITNLTVNGQVWDMTVSEGFLTVNGDANHLLSIAYKRQPGSEVLSFSELVRGERNGRKMMKLYVGNIPENSEPNMDKNFLGRYYNKEGRIMLEVKGFNGRIFPSVFSRGVSIQLEATKISE